MECKLNSILIFNIKKKLVNKELFVILILSLLFLKVAFKSFLVVSIFGGTNIIFILLFFNSEYKKLLALSIFIIWFFITSFWSPLPIYTFFKAFYLLIILNSAILAGYIVDIYKFKRYYLIFIKFFVIWLIFFAVFHNGNITQFESKLFGYKAFFQHSNHFGNSVLFLILLSLIIYNKINFTHVLLLIFLVSSYNRTAILTLLLFLILILFFINKKVFYTNVSLILGLILFVHFLFTGVSFVKYINKGRENIYISRIPVYEESFSSLSGDLILVGEGYGISSVSSKYNFLNNSNIFNIKSREKGSTFLAIIEETGILGLFFFLLSVLFFVRENNLLNLQNKLFFIFVFVSFVHTQIENWMIGPNSVMFYCFFFIVGLFLNRRNL